MLKVVLDTNIFVSSVFWEEGNPHKAVELALDGKIQVFASVAILEELEKVLRLDFEEPEDMVKRQVNLILQYAHLVKVEVSVNAVKEDPEDNKILECAIASGADYIVTGDRHLLKIGNYGETKIVTARTLVELFAA